jgi:hypothetical protein
MPCSVATTSTAIGRLGFVVYGGMSRRDWRQVAPTDVDFDPHELESNSFRCFGARRTRHGIRLLRAWSRSAASG